METEADAKLTLTELVRFSTGGEMVPQGEAASRYTGIMIAAKEPDAVTAQASLERVKLADDAGAFDFASDADESIKARDSRQPRILQHRLQIIRALRRAVQSSVAGGCAASTRKKSGGATR
jgi:hypothetical protein